MPIVPPASARILPGYAGHAVSIAAQATLNPGDSIDLPIDALRNNYGQTILLDSLRWTADAQQQVESAVPPTAPVGLIGRTVEVSLSLNDKVLTGGEVPLYVLGRPAGLDVESMILAVADDTNTQMLLGSYCSGVWGLDHPLQLDPGNSLSVHLTNHGLLNLPILVSIAVTGRIGQGLPSSRWLPYVAAWSPPAFDPTAPTATAPTVVTSTERDLVNRCGQPLHVFRFLGRIARLGVVGTNATINVENVFPDIEEQIGGLPFTNFFPNAVDASLSITMRDSEGNDNIPFAIPFRQAFEPQQKAWECPHVMAPDAYFIAQLSLAPPTVFDQSIQPSISLLGFYEGA